MNPRGRNFSEDSQIIRPNSSLLTAIEDLLLKIPIDLIIQIFSRLPVKSIASCRCVSKRWASVLRRPDFTELFFTKSLARPQLLFARKNEDKTEVIFFSTPQPQNPLHDSSPIVTAIHHAVFPIGRLTDINSAVNGYACISEYRILTGREAGELVLGICNPSTGQCFPLPKMKKRKMSETSSFLGYDPVEKHHKVLAMTRLDNRADEHQVLTLRGNGNLTWRRIECGIPHSFPSRESVCINGVLYYVSETSSIVVCFDVRSEKFSSVTYMEREIHFDILINFQGKLASVRTLGYYLSETSTSFEMWILEDPEKHEWSKRVFNLPPTWKDVVVAWERLYVVGVTATNEFVFSVYFPSDLIHVYYYNFVNEAIARVEIQGMGPIGRCSRLYTFLNHVEDVKLVSLF